MLPFTQSYLKVHNPVFHDKKFWETYYIWNVIRIFYNSKFIGNVYFR